MLIDSEPKEIIKNTLRRQGSRAQPEVAALKKARTQEVLIESNPEEGQILKEALARITRSRTKESAQAEESKKVTPNKRGYRRPKGIKKKRKSAN